MRKTFLASALAVAVVLLGACTMSQEQQWMQLIGVLVSAVPNIVPLLTANPQAENAANQVQSDYRLAQSLLTQYQAKTATATDTLQRVSAALSDAETNLDAILAAAHVNNPSTQQKIQAAVNLAITVTQDLLADLPSSTHSATVAHVELPKQSGVQNQFNHIFAK